MGRETKGVYPSEGGGWQVDKYWDGVRIRQRGFPSYAEAEGWLIKELAKLRTVRLHGERQKRTLDEAAAQYVRTHADKISLQTDVYLLAPVLDMLGIQSIDRIYDETLAPFIEARRAQGCANKTINESISVVGRILRLAERKWRDENGTTWLDRAPALTKLPIKGHQREPRPISWLEQATLLQHLPPHLRRMSLFALNTGARDDVICSLRWEWELYLPEVGASVFYVPKDKVKGRKQNRVLVLNSVAQGVLEDVRGQDEDFVFVWRRERIKNLDRKPEMPYRPIETMNNTAWQNARKAAGLGDLHVHDLRHTVGMRLREAGVPTGTISDLLWHSTGSITLHYTMAQVVELHAALEKIREDSGRWNRSIAAIKREQEAARGKASPPKVPRQRKTG